MLVALEDDGYYISPHLSILSWCNVNLRQCGGNLLMPSNTFPPFLFEHKATNAHLHTPYFTTFGSKLWCKRWETLALRQNSLAKVASVAFSILCLVLHYKNYI